MTPASTLVSTDQIVLVPISLIRPNPDNPRGPVFPVEAQAMAESMREKGQKVAILIRPMTDQEKTQYPPYEYLLLGGHVRLEGAKLAGLETLKAIISEPNNAIDEMMDAALDNRYSDMGWWRWDLLIEWFLKTPNPPTQQKLAAQLKFAPSKISRAYSIMKSLNQASRELVTENLQKSLIFDVLPQNTQNKAFLITETHLQVLADLEDSTLVEKGLREVLDNYLTEGQTRKWVAQFKSPKVTAEKPENTIHKNPVEEEALSASHSTPSGRTGQLGAVSANDSNNVAQKNPTPTQEPGSFSNVLLGEMAGISLFSRVRAKLKKGGNITTAEFLILALHDLAEIALWTWKKALHPVLKMLLGLAKKTLHFTWKLLKESVTGLLKALGKPVYAVAKVILSIALFVGLAWLGWDIYKHGVWHPVRSIERKLGVAKGETKEQPEVSAAANQAVQQPEIVIPSVPSGQASQNEPIGSAPRNDSLRTQANSVQPSQSAESAPDSNASALQPIPVAKAEPAAASQPVVQTQSSSQAPSSPLAGVPAKDQPKKPDLLGQVGDVAGKAAGGVNVAKKLFGL